MRQAAYLTVLSCHYGCLSYQLAQNCHWSIQKKCGACFLCNIVCLLPFLPSPSILEAKIEDRVLTPSHFARGHGWTGVPKNVLMGRWDMVFATEGRNDMSEVTKEPCYRCAKGAGGKNGPK